MKEMIGKRDKFWGGSEKQSALELRWRLATDCSRHGFQPPETRDRRQWTAVYVGSPAVRTTTTGDGGGWNRRRAGCSLRDTVTPDHARIGKQASQSTYTVCHTAMLTSSVDN